MAKRSSSGGVIVAGIAVGVAAWYLWTRKPLVLASVKGAPAPTGSTGPGLPPLCTNIPIPAIDLGNGVVIGGEPNMVCTAGG